MYNDIVRRAHLPRELPIRRIMAGTGVDLALYGPSSSDTLGEEEASGEESTGEEAESEEEENDPCHLSICWFVHVCSIHIHIYKSNTRG